MAKSTERQLISFTTSSGELLALENHIDTLRIKLRKKGIKFSKKQMYHYLFRQGMDNFNADAFIEYLNAGAVNV